MKWKTLFSRATPKPAILMYHRVAQVSHDPWGLAVSPENFRSQIEALCRERLPIGMDEFVIRAQAGDLQPTHVAITFDDAYVDNLTNALPCLNEHRAPATVFAISRALLEGASFWWDELADLCLVRAGGLDTTLDIGGREIRVVWSQADVADPDWRAMDPPPGARERAFLDLYLTLKTAPQDDRERAMAVLSQAADPYVAGDARSMTVRELREFLGGDLVSLGGHSVSHPPLASCPLDLAERELRECLDMLRQRFDAGPMGFAFPYGSTSQDVSRAAKAAGYSWACSTRASFVRSEDIDTFDLPRFAVLNCHGEALLKALRV